MSVSAGRRAVFKKTKATLVWGQLSYQCEFAFCLDLDRHVIVNLYLACDCLYSLIMCLSDPQDKFSA